MTLSRGESPNRWVRRNIGSGAKQPPTQMAAAKSIGPSVPVLQVQAASLRSWMGLCDIEYQPGSAS
jgi:hypothetical protein